MKKTYSLADKDGNIISIDDLVIYEIAPASLLEGLPSEDQMAIKQQAGKPVKVVGFDEYGHAEVEFTDDNGTLHSIWINPKTLLKFRCN